MIYQGKKTSAPVAKIYDLAYSLCCFQAQQNVHFKRECAQSFWAETTKTDL
jgi:hypothetical protein